MAIVQVSRITNRKGLTENLPQLAGAELGWCIDSRRLFVGNGTLQAGAPVIGNTEILTEFSDITALSEYTYQDIVVGYAAQTGPTASDPVIRSVQAKLDDFASVRDFGAVGDGMADDTVAINRALFQLYCREVNSQIRRALYFPAGTYRVTSSIIIPTYAKLVGEGADCTIISLDQAVDISSLTAYVARFSDSLQQTGVNIGDNGAIAPRNIEISSMTFQTGPITDVFLVEDATQCYFDSVNFRGPYTVTYIQNNDALVAADNIAGVRFDSSPSTICNQITFDKCRFSGLTYGISTDQNAESVTVSNGNFNTLYQGIVLENSGSTSGPTGFRAVGNMFDDIWQEGIVYDDVQFNVSAYNVFYNVGNEFGISALGPVITFATDTAASVGDLFERSEADNNLFKRVSVTGTPNTQASDISQAPGVEIQLGKYSRQVGRSFTLADGASNVNIFTISAVNSRAWKMDYYIQRATNARTGTMTVTTDGTTVSYNDDFENTADLGVTLTPTVSTGSVIMRYTTTSTGSSATFNYSLNYLS